MGWAREGKAVRNLLALLLHQKFWGRAVPRWAAWCWHQGSQEDQLDVSHTWAMLGGSPSPELAAYPRLSPPLSPGHCPGPLWPPLLPLAPRGQDEVLTLVRFWGEGFGWAPAASMSPWTVAEPWSLQGSAGLTIELRAWGSRVPTSVCSALAQAKGGESPRRDPQASEPLSQETRGRFPGQKPECACAGVPGPMRVCAHAGALGGGSPGGDLTAGKPCPLSMHIHLCSAVGRPSQGAWCASWGWRSLARLVCRGFGWVLLGVQCLQMLVK